MNKKVNVNQNPSEPVLHESQLPLLKKPSFQYILSISLGVTLIIALAIFVVNGYFGNLS